MYSVGRLLYVICIALTVVFTSLFVASCWYFFFYAPVPSVLSDMQFFTLVIVLPFVLMVLSGAAVRVGYQMQHGKDGRAGGVLAILFGWLFVSIGTTSPVDPTPSGRAARSAYIGLGEQMTNAGLKLAQGENVEMAYPLDVPDKKLYEQRKRDLGVFSVVGILTILATYTIFKFFS